MDFKYKEYTARFKGKLNCIRVQNTCLDVELRDLYNTRELERAFKCKVGWIYEYVCRIFRGFKLYKKLDVFAMFGLLQAK